MRTKLGRWLLIAALLGGGAAWGGGMTSTIYAIPSDTLNAGVDRMTSASYRLQSSLGDPFFAGYLSSPSYALGSGFWNQIARLTMLCPLDLDGNGTIDAHTDGLMILRALFGLTGTPATTGAIGTMPSRTTWAQIQPLIHPAALDVDGNGVTDALTDGLLIVRAMLGLTGTAVTNGAVGATATRGDWAAIRNFLNTNCGTAFPP